MTEVSSAGPPNADLPDADLPDAGELVGALEAEARRLGFSLFGVTSADDTAHMPLYESWLADGRHGEMGWMGRDDSIARRADLRGTMETVRSVVVVGHEYYQEDEPGLPEEVDRAIVARYARGDDYHDVVKAKLVALLEWLDGAVESGVRGRPYVDTGPILERDLARRAGLGWFGRNTMLIDPTRGSYFFIGVLLVDLELPPSEPFEADRCGSCRACLDACPTGALLGRDDDGAPVIDARKCISYLTIELRGAIPLDLRPAIGNRVFGCDICQEVCPWNSFARPVVEPAYLADRGLNAPKLEELTAEVLALDDEGFRERFRGSPVRRTKRGGLLRNLCVALGNRLSAGGGVETPDGAAVGDGRRERAVVGSAALDEGAERAVGVLTQALDDLDPLVRMHAAWALGQSDAPASRSALAARLVNEADPDVHGEIEAALAR